MPLSNRVDHLIRDLLAHGAALRLLLIKHDHDLRKIRGEAYDFWATWVEINKQDHNAVIDFLRTQQCSVDAFLDIHLGPLEKFDECSRRELHEAVSSGVKRQQFINRGRFAVHKPAKEERKRTSVARIEPPTLSEEPTLDEVIQQNELYRKQVVLLERELAQEKRDKAILLRKVQRQERAIKTLLKAVNEEKAA